MFDLNALQAALREFGFDAWLLCDFRGSNMLARRVLDMESRPVTTRRWYYMIPAEGEPIRLVHRIETGALDHLPGRKSIYLRWSERDDLLGAALAGKSRVAMEYSPRNANPYIARVDAGTVELVRSFGADVVPSGDLIQRFEATWGDDQWDLHRRAERVTTSAYDLVWSHIAQKVRAGEPVSEYSVQQLIMGHFRANGVTTASEPHIAVGPHSGDPHFDTSAEHDTPIRAGDFVLVDLWAKADSDRGVYSDLTRVGYVGESVPAAYTKVFAVVAEARDAAIDLIRGAFAAGRALQGYEVDDAARAVIERAGYGDAFIHRTGHSIGREVHGNGANMDNLETHEERLVMRRTCFSIEPGIYLPEFGVRSEVNVYIDGDGNVHPTGGPLQREVVPILRDF